MPDAAADANEFRVVMLGHDQLIPLVDDCMGVLQKVFPDFAQHPGRQGFVTKHIDNPFGVSIGCLLYSGERLVGLRLLLRWKFARGAEVLHALQPVDTALLPEFQGKGLFSRLMRSTLGSVDEGVLVFNFPNAISRPIYLKYGWSKYPYFIKHVCPMHLLAFARKRLLGQRGRSVAAHVQDQLPGWSDAIVDAFLERCRREQAPEKIVTRWTRRALLWRQQLTPSLFFRVVAEAGEMQALYACALYLEGAGAREYRLLQILDNMVLPGNEDRYRVDLLQFVTDTGIDEVQDLAGIASVPARFPGWSLFKKQQSAVFNDQRLLAGIAPEALSLSALDTDH